MSLASYSPVTPLRSPGLAASFVASEGSCVVKRVVVTNTSEDTALYLHIFDAGSVPDDGEVPVTAPVEVAAGAINGDDWRPDGMKLERGCVCVLSETQDTLTKTASEVGRFFVELVR